MTPLFDDPSPQPSVEPLEEGAVLLRGFARAEASALMQGVEQVAAAAPFRHLVTPGGYTMSVAMTNCGRTGWVSDRAGYRYDANDPDTGKPWPPMPAAFLELAARAASEAGFAGYDPDACLINRYAAGAKLGMHQDRDEKDAWAPIVSVSLGLPAVFIWGGKSGRTRCAGCASKAETWRYGADLRVSSITASLRSKRAIILSPAPSASISRFARCSDPRRSAEGSPPGSLSGRI